MKRSLFLLFGFAALLTIVLAPVAAAQGPFAGERVVIVTQTGSSIGGPARTYGEEWADANGAEVEVVQVSFGDLFPTIMNALENGTQEFDVLIYATNWMGNIAGGDYVLPVPEDIKAAIDWEDILPLYRERIADWGGTTYAVPWDGDSHMLYYRKDLINPSSPFAGEFASTYGYTLDEPQTWNQYRDMAEFFNNRTVDTAGLSAPIFGVAEAQRGSAQSYWFLMSRAGGYAKAPNDPYFFFDEEMNPLINTPGWVRGLEDWVAIGAYGAPGIRDFDVTNVRALFPAGAVVFGLDWGDVGPLTVDPAASTVQGLAGFGVLPGAEEYWDRTQGAWVQPTSGVNRAPFIAYGGWVISVVADSEEADAAFDLVSYLTARDLAGTLATTGGTGINPLRQSQLDNLGLWTAAGFDEASAQDYLSAIQDTINDPNAILDLRIPGAAEYYAALDEGIQRALDGEVSAQEALDDVVAAWNEITESYGREEQLALYLQSLGISNEG